MKKFFVTMVFALILTAAPASFNLLANCPPGYTEVTLQFTYWKTGPPAEDCSMEITYCYTCNLAMGVGFDYQITKMHVSDGCTLDNEFWAQVTNLIANDLMNRGCLSPCSWPGWQQTSSTEVRSVCWMQVHQPGWDPWEYDIVPCEGSATCRHYYKVCVTFTQNGAEITYIPDGVQFISGTGCTEVEPEDPPAGVDPKEDYWESYCFTLDPCEE